MEMTNGLVVNTDLCTACRACELACHYHHRGTFGVSSTSIRIDFDGDRGALRIQFDSSCDGCANEPAPQCAHACTPGALWIG